MRPRKGPKARPRRASKRPRSRETHSAVTKPAFRRASSFGRAWRGQIGALAAREPAHSGRLHAIADLRWLRASPGEAFIRMSEIADVGVRELGK